MGFMLFFFLGASLLLGEPWFARLDGRRWLFTRCTSRLLLHHDWMATFGHLVVMDSVLVAFVTPRIRATRAQCFHREKPRLPAVCLAFALDWWLQVENWDWVFEAIAIVPDPLHVTCLLLLLRLSTVSSARPFSVDVSLLENFLERIEVLSLSCDVYDGIAEKVDQTNHVLPIGDQITVTRELLYLIADALLIFLVDANHFLSSCKCLMEVLEPYY